MRRLVDGYFKSVNSGQWPAVTEHTLQACRSRTNERHHVWDQIILRTTLAIIPSYCSRYIKRSLGVPRTHLSILVILSAFTIATHAHQPSSLSAIAAHASQLAWTILHVFQTSMFFLRRLSPNIPSWTQP